MRDERFMRIFERDYPEFFSECYSFDKIHNDYRLMKNNKVMKLIDKLYRINKNSLAEFYFENRNKDCSVENDLCSRRLAFELIKDNYDLILLELL